MHEKTLWEDLKDNWRADPGNVILESLFVFVGCIAFPIWALSWIAQAFK